MYANVLKKLMTLKGGIHGKAGMEKRQGGNAVIII